MADTQSMEQLNARLRKMSLTFEDIESLSVLSGSQKVEVIRVELTISDKARRERIEHLSHVLSTGRKVWIFGHERLADCGSWMSDDEKADAVDIVKNGCTALIIYNQHDYIMLPVQLGVAGQVGTAIN